jgi:hypothetical protein
MREHIVDRTAYENWVQGYDNMHGIYKLYTPKVLIKKEEVDSEVEDKEVLVEVEEGQLLVINVTIYGTMHRIV